jgi:hypothetical protein
MKSKSNIPVDEAVDYPIKKFIPVPILNSENSEVVLLYIPDFEIDNFLSFIEFKSNQVLESDKIMPQLQEYIKDYIRRSAELGVEKRVDYSYKLMVKINFLQKLKNSQKTYPF